MSYEQKINPEALKRIIEDSGLSFKPGSVSWIFTCPRCNKKEKLYIRKRDGRFVCWVCKETDGFQGKPEYALCELLGQSIKSIQEKLYGEEINQVTTNISVNLKSYDEDETVEDQAQELAKVSWPLDFYELTHQHAIKGVTYLAGRGIPLDIAVSYDIRYSPVQNSVVFPVKVDGVLIGWQRRLVISNEWIDELGIEHKIPKSYTMTGLKKEQVLMFGDSLLHSPHAIVCEGPVDALKAHLCGGAVCTMGKGVSRVQMQLIRNSGVSKVYLALDPDAAEETSRLLKELGMESYFMDPRPYEDLGAMSFQEVFELFRRAERVTSNRLFIFLKKY